MKRIFGGVLIFVGALLDLADGWVLIEAARGSVPNYSGEVGFILWFALFGGLMLILGGIGLFR